MNTQTIKVTSRGRVVMNPKRFTPSSLSPPPLTQPTNQLLTSFNGTIHRNFILRIMYNNFLCHSNPSLRERRILKTKINKFLIYIKMENITLD